MDDSLIVERLWERDQSALAAVSAKYGRYCTAIAFNILGDEQSAEECVNDTLLELWEAIPPNRPKNLTAFIVKIARNNAFNMIKGMKAMKRGGVSEISRIAGVSEANVYSILKRVRKKLLENLKERGV